MASWVTHLMIADSVLEKFTDLDRHGFCVGNIAPDCNVENEDWTAFTPSRKVTHWMRGVRKGMGDCDAFCQEYLAEKLRDAANNEQYSFLLGYYSHLITDAAFQAMIRNEKRVESAWNRIRADEELNRASAGMDESWDSIKKLISKQERMRDIETIEAEYLDRHPDSGYMTEILPLKEFPDYVDYMPKGCIVRKIGVMGYVPEVNKAQNAFIALSREEYAEFVDDAIRLVIEQFVEKKVYPNLFLDDKSF